MIEKIDHKFENNKEEKIKDLITDILSLKRQKEKEGDNESEEIKLARRLEQRSYPKLSEEILKNIILRYEIDNDKLPTKKILIKLMINYLGNIQKSPENYNFPNNSEEVNGMKLEKRIGNGRRGEIFAVKPETVQTKKIYKCFAFKRQKKNIPYPLDIHIASAILLALYDFQPKYYNQYFMEINEYKNKNIQRAFKNVNFEYKYLLYENEISWHILYYFTNIRDQLKNMMQRQLNGDYVKIDIAQLNSENRFHIIGVYLEYLDRFKDNFLFQKTKIIKELDKILILEPEFIIDLIVFRAKRGCFQIPDDILANQIDYLSSSYNVIKINKKEGEGFLEKVVKKCKQINNDDLIYWANPAFSWMLFKLLEMKILSNEQYDNYIYKFCEKAKIFKKISKKLRGNNNNNGKKDKNKDEINKLNIYKEFNDKNKDEIKNLNNNKEIINKKKDEIIKLNNTNKIIDKIIHLNNNKEIVNKNKDEIIKLNINKEIVDKKKDEIIKISNNNEIIDKNKDEIIKLKNNKENINKKKDEIIKLNNNKEIIDKEEDEMIKINNYDEIIDIKNNEIIELNNSNEIIDIKNNKIAKFNNFINTKNDQIDNGNNLYDIIDKIEEKQIKNDDKEEINLKNRKKRQKKKTKKKSGWFCCGEDALEVL